MQVSGLRQMQECQDESLGLCYPLVGDQIHTQRKREAVSHADVISKVSGDRPLPEMTERFLTKATRVTYLYSGHATCKSSLGCPYKLQAFSTQAQSDTELECC